MSRNETFHEERVSLGSPAGSKRTDRPNCCFRLVAAVIQYTVFVPIKIFLCILSLLETSACLWFILICMPTILISPVLYRKIVDFFVEEFCKFTVQLFCITSRATLKLSGVQIDKFDKNSPFIKESLWPVFICNHKTQMDMIAAWLLMYKLDIPCNVIKFMAAAYTRYVPGYGCGLQVMRSIFLTRENTERDLQQIRDIMSFHAFYGIPKGILLYPEGTTVFKASLDSTNRYAAKYNLPPRKYSLYPRHKGLFELLQAMRDTSALNELYDLTIAYEELRGSDDDFTLGRLFFQGPVQRNYHIHVEKYDALDLSEYSEGELKDWLYDVYSEKERRLDYFESNEPPSLNFGSAEGVTDSSFTGTEYCSGVVRIVWHLSLVVLIFVLPWYYIRFYQIHQYVGLIFYPVALIALTLLGFFVGLDRLERFLERIHLIIICWPLIQWKVDHIPCVHSNPEDLEAPPPNKEGLTSRIFRGENNPALRLSNRISVWTARFEIPNFVGSISAPLSTFVHSSQNDSQFDSTRVAEDPTGLHLITSNPEQVPIALFINSSQPISLSSTHITADLSQTQNTYA